jgi:hypothetical protein
MIPNAATRDAEWTWGDMLKSFRALGGIAENIELGEGPRGRGLFARDETKPVLLRVPESLLFQVKDLEFEDDRLRLKSATDAGDRERAFFERYQRAFSWGAGGRTESAEFVAALDGLPAEVRDILTADFGLRDLLEGDPAGRAQMRFLDSRVIKKAGSESEYLMPLVELANHDAEGLSFDFRRDLQILGKVSGEILVNYGVHDSLSIFQAFGFATRQPNAFSLPSRLALSPREIFVRKNTSLVPQRGMCPVPQLHFDATRVELSHLMIGHSKFPRLSRGIFRMLMKEAGVPDPDEVFDQILHLNWTRWLRLLAALAPHEGEMIVLLRRVAHYQLETMSHCVGSRDPGLQAPPKRQIGMR